MVRKGILLIAEGGISLCTYMAHAAVKSKIGFQTPVREPVSTDDHPLSPTVPTDDPPDSDFSRVVPPPAPIEEEDPNSEQEKPAPQVENVFGDEEDTEEDEPKTDEPSLSEKDQALTEDEESSYGDLSNFAATPNLQKLV